MIFGIRARDLSTVVLAMLSVAQVVTWSRVLELHPHPGLSHHQSRQLAAADRRRPVSPSHTGRPQCSTPSWFDCAPIIMTTMTPVTNVQSVHDVTDRISYLSVLLQQQQSLLWFYLDVKHAHNNDSIFYWIVQHRFLYLYIRSLHWIIPGLA